jgi:hypothetical protein
MVQEISNAQTVDILYGFDAIGAFLRMTGRQAKHRALLDGLPTFRLGRTVCARESALLKWLAEQEAVGGSKTPEPEGRGPRSS